MVHFATKLTLAKRRVLEDPDLYPPSRNVGGAVGDAQPENLSRSEQRNRRRKVRIDQPKVAGRIQNLIYDSIKIVFCGSVAIKLILIV